MTEKHEIKEYNKNKKTKSGISRNANLASNPSYKIAHLTNEFFNRIGQEQSFEQTNTCSECASLIKLITSIEDPAVIKQILAHLGEKAA